MDREPFPQLEGPHKRHAAVENYLNPEKKPLWLRLLTLGFFCAILALIVFLAFVFYLTTCAGQTRWNPAFQGFQGYWDRDRGVEQDGEHWRLDLGKEHTWLISTYRNDVSVVVDSGTWTEIGERTYRLDSKNGSRTAVLSQHDEWVMEIDGVKYIRVVK